MARIFITGSADGLGQLAAKELVRSGHQVVLHARSEERGKAAMAAIPGADNVVTADLSSMEETKALAVKLNALASFDAVIHNAGVYQVPKNSISEEGLQVLFAVNTLAPYILTCLMEKPKRLIYLGSGMHSQGDASLNNLPGNTQRRNRSITYSDTKLHGLILAMAVARSRTDGYSNAVDPGWVPTKMGGSGAPDNLEEGYQTQVWLAVSDDAAACVNGKYFHHKKQTDFLPAANDIAVQEKFITLCRQITGVPFTDQPL